MTSPTHLATWGTIVDRFARSRLQDIHHYCMQLLLCRTAANPIRTCKASRANCKKLPMHPRYYNSSSMAHEEHAPTLLQQSAANQHKRCANCISSRLFGTLLPCQDAIMEYECHRLRSSIQKAVQGCAEKQPHTSKLAPAHQRFCPCVLARKEQHHTVLFGRCCGIYGSKARLPSSYSCSTFRKL
jgi:hypothetical protein